MGLLSNIILILVYLGIYFLAVRVASGKLEIVPELVKLSYALISAVIFVLIFVFLLDVVCYLVSGGWVNPEDHRFIGSWPIVSGTLRSALFSPASHVMGLLFGFGMMARIIMGNKTPMLLSFLDED